MVTKDDALKLALEALENSIDAVRQEYETDWRHGYPTREAQLASMKAGVEAHQKAITEIKKALAHPDYRAVKTYHEGKPVYVSQPEQEPVAFMEAKADNECADAYADGWNACVNAHKNSTPPKRPWVGLTDEEKSLDGAPVRYGIEEAGSWASGAEWAEAKLKEKNT